MKDKITISKIEIKIADKVIPLTLEQAKELKEILNETFPEPTSYPIVVDRPVYIDRYPFRPYTYWGASYSCSGQTNGSFTNAIQDATLALEGR